MSLRIGFCLLFLCCSPNEKFFHVNFPPDPFLEQNASDKYANHKIFLREFHNNTFHNFYKSFNPKGNKIKFIDRYVETASDAAKVIDLCKGPDVEKNRRYKKLEF